MVTPEQSEDLIESYNKAKKEADFSQEQVEYYEEKQRINKTDSRSAKKEAEWDAKHSFQLGVMSGIDTALSMLDLSLVLDDDGVAVGIEEA